MYVLLEAKSINHFILIQA